MAATSSERPLLLPPLRRTEDDARRFAFIAHLYQEDKAGHPYWHHLDRIATRLAASTRELGDRKRDEALQIAWLHDVIEDTGYDEAHLSREGFSNDVIAGVSALTKAHSSVTYATFIDTIAQHGSLPAILVKIADIQDNSDPERLALLDEPTRERLKAKYAAALPVLQQAAARLGWKSETLPASPDPS